MTERLFPYLEQEWYRSSRGRVCPYCNSDRIGADTAYPHGDSTDEVERVVTCLNCEKKWVEVLRLAYIEEVEE